jgi:hypothetical protein
MKKLQDVKHECCVCFHSFTNAAAKAKSEVDDRLLHY